MSPQSPDSPKPGQKSIRTIWVALIGILVAVLLVLTIVFLTLFLVERFGGSDSVASAGGGATGVTSPYDLFEAPADSGPGDIEDAYLVSVSVLEDDGQTTFYGLNSSEPAAQALIEAVTKADEVHDSGLSTSTTIAGEADEDELGGSTLTFMLPDRTTLTFDLYVEEGLIARAGRVWRVEGDLKSLVQDAVAAGAQ